MCLEGEYLSADGRKMNEGVLHGGKQKAGRAAWAKELAYLHVEVHEAGDCWARLFKTNQDEDNRATIPHSPEEGEPPTAQLGPAVGCLWVPLKCLRVPLECILCARQGAHMAPGQVSDQCQIVLGANLANLGPYPIGRTLWKSGVQYATKHMRLSLGGDRRGDRRSVSGPPQGR